KGWSNRRAHRTKSRRRLYRTRFAEQEELPMTQDESVLPIPLRPGCAKDVRLRRSLRRPLVKKSADDYTGNERGIVCAIDEYVKDGSEVSAGVRRGGKAAGVVDAIGREALTSPMIESKCGVSFKYLVTIQPLSVARRVKKCREASE